MKVWCAVYQNEGVITNMEAFPALEKAREYFFSVIDKIEDCDPDWFQDGSEDGYFYWNNGMDADTEVSIWPVEMEMEE